MIDKTTRSRVEDHQARFDTWLEHTNVIPVIVMNSVEDAVPLAEALATGGLTVLEVTLRTPNAPKVLEAMAGVDGVVVGAGTLLSADNIVTARSAGAVFGVSPGWTDAVLNAAETQDLPLLPGSDNVSSSMALAERGYTFQKFFPAEPSGGATKLKAMSQPLPHIRFCPTGGITPETFPQYISLPNVVCVGGSWLTPANIIEKRDWKAITDLAKACAVGPS
ncbi:MAG: bifunctional 4-hydroxy-2-oxoglutarate aldolase/2-dehydro-3-deoxy-phosphogluconate aldolase [Pseudomonadota bacterium]